MITGIPFNSAVVWAKQSSTSVVKLLQYDIITYSYFLVQLDMKLFRKKYAISNGYWKTIENSNMVYLSQYGIFEGVVFRNNMNRYSELYLSQL